VKIIHLVIEWFQLIALMLRKRMRKSSHKNSYFDFYKFSLESVISISICHRDVTSLLDNMLTGLRKESDI
jgi:hypothetical protein